MRNTHPITFISITVAVIGSVMPPHAVVAQCELTKLTELNAGGVPATNDRFGSSVAIGGDYAVIGAVSDNPTGSGTTGAAYVFKRAGTNWNFVQSLTPSTIAAGDRFGESVAIDGNYIVVGARNGDAAVDNTNTGNAFVFFNDGSGDWLQQGDPLVAAAPVVNDRFGNSVAISGNVIVVGAPRTDDVDSSTGSAFVFRRTGTTWTREQKLVASDPFLGDEFGISVAISGNVIVVGSWNNDLGVAGISNAGAAYVFRYNSGESKWVQEKKLVASDPTASAGLGVSVAIDGTTVLVGADKADGNAVATGAGYVFQFAEDEWTQVSKLTADDGVILTSFGIAVALRGDIAAIGANRDFDPAVPSEPLIGAMYAFKREAGTWVQLGKIEAGDPCPFSEYGLSVATDGTYALAGALNQDHDPTCGVATHGNNYGAAYVVFIAGEDTDPCGICGDGIVGGSEICDDGEFNGTEAGFCLADCSAIQLCGDAAVNGTEECDGNVDGACAGQVCRRNCTCAPPTCGDGIRDVNEACDGNDDELCRGLGCKLDCTCGLPKSHAPMPGDVPMIRAIHKGIKAKNAGR